MKKIKVNEVAKTTVGKQLKAYYEGLGLEVMTNDSEDFPPNMTKDTLIIRDFDVNGTPVDVQIKLITPRGKEGVYKY